MKPELEASQDITANTNDAGYVAEELPWPRFAIGEVVRIQGYPFSILRINASSIVLQPLPARGYGSPRTLIQRMTGRGA